jgi:alkylated DNA repair dioxygenase AlkB
MTRIELGLGAWVELHESWLSPASAARLCSALRAELAWEQRHIVLFGKRILQPRLIAWAGALPYRYSGQTLEPRPWPALLGPELGALAASISAVAGAAFNHVLVNRYRDGQDSMGYHSDAEPELGPDPVVAALSLGRARRFLLRPRRSKKGERALSLLLTSGSLLVMGGTCQRHQRHAIPRDSGPAAPGSPSERISLTYRRLLAAPAAATDRRD